MPRSQTSAQPVLLCTCLPGAGGAGFTPGVRNLVGTPSSLPRGQGIGSRPYTSAGVALWAGTAPGGAAVAEGGCCRGNQQGQVCSAVHAMLSPSPTCLS